MTEGGNSARYLLQGPDRSTTPSHARSKRFRASGAAVKVFCVIAQRGRSRGEGHAPRRTCCHAHGVRTEQSSTCVAFDEAFLLCRGKTPHLRLRADTFGPSTTGTPNAHFGPG